MFFYGKQKKGLCLNPSSIRKGYKSELIKYVLAKVEGLKYIEF